MYPYSNLWQTYIIFENTNIPRVDCQRIGFRPGLNLFSPLKGRNEYRPCLNLIPCQKGTG